MNIAVLGDGGWGTTLAVHLSKQGFKVCLWGVFPEYVSRVKKSRENRKFLPGIKIPAGISLTSSLKEALEGRDLVVLAVPSQYMRKVLMKVRKTGFPKKAVYLSVTKGIEIGSLKRMTDVVHDVLGKVRVAVLSGPTIAHEVALGMPAVAVIASADRRIRVKLQRVFNSQRLRIYTNSDVAGVELGGSLKNVIAIACGVSDGLGFGTNAKAAILSRGLAEISRLGIAMGAKAKTFSGISGLGDLVTTCISSYSRNRFVGEAIGKGKNPKKIISRMQMVAEGVPTAKSAHFLSLKYKTDMPIVRETYQIIYKEKSPSDALKDLMQRQMKEE